MPQEWTSRPDSLSKFYLNIASTLPQPFEKRLYRFRPALKIWRAGTLQLPITTYLVKQCAPQFSSTLAKAFLVLPSRPFHAPRLLVERIVVKGFSKVIPEFPLNHETYPVIPRTFEFWCLLGVLTESPPGASLRLHNFLILLPYLFYSQLVKRTKPF